MRRKRLNHYADVFCKMFVGWRMADDLEIMSEIPDGTITINVLTGEASHSVVGRLNLLISKELQAWLYEQGTKEGIDISKIVSALLEVDVDTSKVTTNRERIIGFNFVCRSNIKTEEASYAAQFTENNHWHTRFAT